MKSINANHIEKTDLEKSVYNDIQSEIRKYYDSEEVKYKNNEEPEDTIINFFSYLYRLIPPVERNVHYSKELLKKIDLKELSEEHIAVKKYKDAFVAGTDMNIFLSNNIKNASDTDFLLYTWHLYHLHMSGKFVNDNKQMKNNRSDTQLLCIITLKDVYFVDVIKHPTKPEEYFDIRSLEIIVQNGWIEHIGFIEITDMIPGTLQPEITASKDIFELYSKCSSNIAFEFQNKGYCSLEPMSSIRRPSEVTYTLIRINIQISKLNSIDGTYKGFRLGCNKQGKLMGLVDFETPTRERTCFDIF